MELTYLAIHTLTFISASQYFISNTLELLH